MKETALWQLIRRNNPRIFWTRLESGSTALGIPDAVGIYEGATTFLEFKNGNDPSEWTPFQRRWARECTEHGGVYRLVYGYDDGHIAVTDSFNRNLVDNVPSDWEEFRRLIWG